MALGKTNKEPKPSLSQRVRKFFNNKYLAYSLGAALAVTPVLGCSADTNISFVQHYQGRTNTSSGRVTLKDRTIRTKRKKTKQDLPGITAHYLFDGETGLIQVLNASGNDQPEFKQTRTSPPTSSAKRGLTSSTYALDVEDLFLIETVGSTIKRESITINQGDFLGRNKNFNRYCMTMQQIKETNIQAPIGLIFLVPQKVFGVAAEVIKLPTTHGLEKIMNTYVVSKFGVQLGYEVWVPKTAMSVCGEEYTSIICDISRDKLARIWSPDLPFWMIKGGCTPQKHSSPSNPDSGVKRYTDQKYAITDTTTNLMWGLPCIKSYNGDWNTSKRYCNNRTYKLGHSDWRLPTISELKTLLLSKRTGDCHIDPVFRKDGRWHCGEVWSSTLQRPGYASTIDFSRGKIGGKDTKWGSEYSCCVRKAK